MVTGCNLLQLEVSSAWRSTSATPILQLDGNPGRRGRGRGKRGCAERVGREAVVSPAEVSSQEEETLLPLAPLPESNGEVPATLSPGLSDDQSHHLTTPPTSPTELMKRNMESYLARAVQLSNSKRVSGDSPSTASPQRLSKGKKRQPSCPQAPPPTSTTTSKAKRKKPLLSPTDVVAMDNKESELEEKKGKKKGKGKKQGKELEKEVEEVEEKEQGKKQEKKMVKKKGKGKKQGKELEKEVEEVEEKKLEKEVEEVEEKEQGKEQEKKMVKKKGKRPTKRPTKGQVEETELAAVSATATTDDTDDVQTSTEPQPSAGKAKKSAVSKKKSKKTSETDVSPVHPSAEADHGETPLVAPTDSLADLEPDLVTPEEKHPTKKAQMPSRAGQKRARKTKSSAVKPGKGRAKKAKVITPDDSNHQQEVDREQEVDQKQEVEGEEVLQEAAAPDKGATFSGKRTRRRVKKPAAATPLIETEIVPHSLPKETPEDQVYATFRRIVAKHKSICCATEGCGYRAISMNAMMYHYNRCGRDALTFTCAHCGKVYTSQAGLKYHLDKNHAEPGTKVDSTQQLLLGASGARKAAEKASSSIAEMVKQQMAPFKESERGADDPCYQETEDGNHDDKEEGEVKPRQSLQKTGDSSAGGGPPLPEPEEEEEEPRLIEEHRLDPALIAALQAGLDSGGWRRYCRVGQRPHLANKQIPLLTNQQASYLRMEVKKEKRVKCPILDCSTYLSSIQALVYHIPRCFTGTLHAAERSCSLCNDFKGTEAKLRRHLQTRHHEVASALDFDEEYKPELLDGLASSASIKWLTKTQHKGTYRKWVRWAWSTADEGFEAGVWRAQLDHWAPLEPETIEDFSGEFPPLNSTARANGIDLSSVTVGTASEVREHMIVLNTGSTILDIDWLHLPPDEVVGGATTHPSTVTKETEDSVAMETDSSVLSKDVTASAGSETVATETKTSSPVAPDSDGSGAVGCDQYLAVSTSCSLTAQDVCSRTMDQGVLQIWRVGSQGAELELCVAHRFGSVRSIKWSPSNAHTPSNGQGLERLGLLALACGDGHGRILSIPSPRQLAKGFLHKEEDPIFPLWVEPLVEQVILSTSPRASSVFTAMQVDPQKKSDAEAEEELEPSLRNVVEQDSLKWIFVGGKGGVGKTTCSCSLALILAQKRESVLLISTDPAHNISDAFDQKFSKQPTLVQGTRNLFAMEIDPAVMDKDDIQDPSLNDGGMSGLAQELMTEFADSLPGIDEAKGFMDILGLIHHFKFSVVVFDTAPTGHTLRFLSIPKLFIKGLSKVQDLKSRFGAMFSQLLPMLGLSGDAQELNSRVAQYLPAVEQLNAEFRNPDMATFVCICIPEFLSLFETERLIQELVKMDIDVHNVVVNQILQPERDEKGLIRCGMCTARHNIQSKYLEQIHDLYEDFHITECPLLGHEVRGLEKVSAFSQHLIRSRGPVSKSKQ